MVEPAGDTYTAQSALRGTDVTAAFGDDLGTVKFFSRVDLRTRDRPRVGDSTPRPS